MPADFDVTFETLDNNFDMAFVEMTQGIKGDKGDAATITIGDVTTGEAGTGVEVINSGTTEDAVFDFVIPQGIKGDTGAQGDKGDKGDTAEVTADNVNTAFIDASEAQKQTARENIGAVAKDVVANALRKTLSGTALRADDISPVPHNITSVQYGQCLQDGTPTTDSPIPITGKLAGCALGNGTATIITQTVTDSNGDPVTLYGLPVVSGGNVTIDGQQYIADTLEGTTVTRRIGKYILDGLANVRKNDANTYIYYVIKGIQAINGICTHFIPSSNWARYSGTFSSVNSTSMIYINFEGVIDTNNVTSVKAWLTSQYNAGTPVTIFYVLSEPTTETVTLSPETLSANSPTTTWTSNAYSEITYNRDINAAYDELATAIVALGGTL